MISFASQCAALIKQGKQIILVSSGAQVAGVSTTKEWVYGSAISCRGCDTSSSTGNGRDICRPKGLTPMLQVGSDP